MGGYLSVLGLVVAKDFQHQGIAGQLLNNFENMQGNMYVSSHSHLSRYISKFL